VKSEKDDCRAAQVVGLTWRMVGVNDDGSVELYARVQDLTWSELAPVSRTVGQLSGQLSDLVGELVGSRHLGGPVVLRPSGLSLVVSPSGTPPSRVVAVPSRSQAGEDAVNHSLGAR
jgi:hypothetical protein